MTSSMGAKLGEGEVAPAAAQVKSQLLAQLDSLVQQCENRFSNRYELATEYDSTVASLCQSLETILSHGFRRQPPPKTQASSKLKILNGFSSSSLSSSKSASSASSSSSSSLDSHNSSAQLWHFLSQYLTEHEVQRFVSLRNVNTDYGRGRSWLRNALNEHSLEKYLSVILSDDDGLQPTSSSSSSFSHSSKSTSARRKFYHDWALLLDPQQAPLLISITRPLSAVLFALSIDRPDLDVEEASSFAGTKSSPKGGNTSEEARLKPVKKKSSSSGSGNSSAASSGVQAALVKSRKKKSTIVTINDEEEDLESSDLENGDLYARSAPVPSFMKLAAAGSSSADLETHRTSTASKSKNPSSLLSIADTTTDALKTSTMVLYPLYDNHEGASSPADISGYDSPTPTDTTSESITSDQQQNKQTPTINPDDGHSPSSSSSSLPVANKRLQEQIDFLQLEKEKILRDNSLLKIQLNKYLAALELLKYNHSRSGETAAALSANQQQPPKNKEEEGGDSEVEVYERKLVQVSEMHGELVEFNEHLYRVIQQKDSIIGRLRDELVELRGPLPDNDDLLSISSEAATTAVAATSVADQSLSLPLIHVWIPTAFLSGGFKGKSHHIYQIYLRIRDEEWNVYRRYSQFYALHKGLKARHPTVGGFEFPPKKALGNKDSKVVQERRKKLETYLRNVLNYLQTTAASTGGDHISSKERLIAAVPFLSDKFFLQDRSHSVSDTNLNASSSVGGGGGHSRSNTQSTVQQAPQSQHYMGF